MSFGYIKIILYKFIKIYSLNLFKIPLCRNIEPKPVIDMTKEFIGEIKEIIPPKIIGLIDMR